MERTTYRGTVPVCQHCEKRFSLLGIRELLLGRSVNCKYCAAQHRIASSASSLEPSRWRLITVVLVSFFLVFIVGEVVAFAILALGALVFGLSVIRKRLDRVTRCVERD